MGVGSSRVGVRACVTVSQFLEHSISIQVSNTFYTNPAKMVALNFTHSSRMFQG